MIASLPIWRSLLFVPVTARRFIDGAARRGADAIILDLEDSVAASEKDRARELVPEAAMIVSRGGADVVVRINLAVAHRGPRHRIRRSGRVCWRGLAEDRKRRPRPAPCRGRRRDRSPARHRAWNDAADRDGRNRGSILSSCRDCRRPSAALRAHPWHRGLRHLGRHSARRRTLSMPKQMAVFAARAAGIMPLGFIGSIAEFHDLDGFSVDTRRSRRFGFIGASRIHPSQVPILNEEFRPTAAEVDHARRVLAAYDRRWPTGWARSPSTAK